MSAQKTKVPSERDIVRGLDLVEQQRYGSAMRALESGLTWLQKDPSFTTSTDPLVSQEAKYISRLIEQIETGRKKGIFASSHSLAIAFVRLIEAEAKMIGVIDERRQKAIYSTAAAGHDSGTTTRSAPVVPPPDVWSDKAIANAKLMGCLKSMKVYKTDITYEVDEDLDRKAKELAESLGHKLIIVCLTPEHRPNGEQILAADAIALIIPDSSLWEDGYMITNVGLLRVGFTGFSLGQGESAVFKDGRFIKHPERISVSTEAPIQKKEPHL